MSDSSTQSSLLRSLGSFGSEHVTGVSNLTGSYMCVQALGETTVLGDTDGNMGGIENMVIPAGAYVLGEWSVVHTSGDCIIYKK